jgi:hypothetical protein
MKLADTIALYSTPLQDISVAAILSRFQQDAPVQVIGLANALGLNVWELQLPPNISGKIWRDPQNGGTKGYSIGVNAAEAFVRKRFTVAHECAHFILHRDKITDELTEDTLYRGLDGKEEAQANKFAADILMPYHLIQKFMDSGMTDVDELAAKFQVSGAAMRIRLGIPVT